MEWISFLCTRISSIVVTICCTAAAFNKFIFFQFYPQIWKICSSLFLLSNLSHDCLEELLIKGCLLPDNLPRLANSLSFCLLWVWQNIWKRFIQTSKILVFNIMNFRSNGVSLSVSFNENFILCKLQNGSLDRIWLQAQNFNHVYLTLTRLFQLLSHLHNILVFYGIFKSAI